MYDFVIFRKFRRGGDIIAYFPEIQATMSKAECMSYMHIGQHGAASYDCIHTLTKPATPKEYADLKKELEDIGYKLEIRKRISKRWYEIGGFCNG